MVICMWKVILLIPDIFENVWNKCIETNELDPAHFLLAPGLALQACLKKAEIKLELLSHIDMLQMVETGMRGEIDHTID